MKFLWLPKSRFSLDDIYHLQGNKIFKTPKTTSSLMDNQKPTFKQLRGKQKWK